MRSARLRALMIALTGLLIGVASVFALESTRQDAEAQLTQYGWELGAKFNGDSIGHLGGQGLLRECPNGSVLVGLRVDWDYIPFVRRVTGISIACRAVNERSSSVPYIYDPSAGVQTQNWGSITQTATDSVPETGFIAGLSARVRRAPPQPFAYLKPKIWFSSPSYTMSTTTEAVTLSSWGEPKVISFVEKVSGPLERAGDCDGGYFPGELSNGFNSFSGPPITTVKAMRGVRLHTYSEFGVERLGGIRILCQDINRVALSTQEIGEATGDGQAHLKVELADADDPVRDDEQASFTVTVTNQGGGAANGVTVRDTLPSGATFVSALSSQGACQEEGGLVTCNVGTLAPRTNASITIQVSPPAGRGVMVNRATVEAASVDPHPADNSSGQATTVAPAGAVPQFDCDGSLYIANEGNGGGGTTIIRADCMGNITTYATGFNGSSGLVFNQLTGALVISDDTPGIHQADIDGNVTPLAANVALSNPNGLAVDAQASLLVADSGDRVLRLSLDPSGDAASTEVLAQGFTTPQGIVETPAGDVLFSDADGYIYRITPTTPLPVVAPGIAQRLPVGRVAQDNGLHQAGRNGQHLHRQLRWAHRPSHRRRSHREGRCPHSGRRLPDGPGGWPTAWFSRSGFRLRGRPGRDRLLPRRRLHLPQDVARQRLEHRYADRQLAGALRPEPGWSARWAALERALRHRLLR